MSLPPGDMMTTLRRKLRQVFARYRPDAVLFSGGLDSSIAAALSPCRRGTLVTLGPDGPDLKYARQAARAIGMDLTHRAVCVGEAIDTIPEVITILRSFDPAIPNDLAVYFALKESKSLGFKSVMTGDASDELFGGYSYMEEIEDLDGYIRDLSGIMSFNSALLGKYFGIEVMQPFLDKEILDFALQIQGKWKIKNEKGKLHGKWILRRALEGILPRDILWQGKRPLEAGSGMTRLNSIIASTMTDEKFEEKRRSYPVKFFNKAHLFYYEVYKQIFGNVPPPKTDEKACGGCGAGIRVNRSHCRVCGWIEGDWS